MTAVRETRSRIGPRESALALRGRVSPRGPAAGFSREGLLPEMLIGAALRGGALAEMTHCRDSTGGDLIE
jgi:hypothetical protein